jgi:chitinase
MTSRPWRQFLSVLLLSYLQLCTLSDATRPLPPKLLIGYASTCGDGRVERAVRSGVNVVIWSFWNVNEESPIIGSQLNLTCITQLIRCLDEDGFDDTLYLASIGGWNGGHLPEEHDAGSIYDAWKDWSNGTFHGIDWDLEGNDILQHRNNHFSLDCLDKMGAISSLAKADGLTVSMAPPQSYFDAGSSKFSRYVNLTDPTRSWKHSEFSYYGANVYACVYAKWGDSIDFVSIQLYESYSRAMYESRSVGVVDYLVKLIGLTEWNVNFSEDPLVELPDQVIVLPPHKLVIGLANGWADGEKSMFISPREIERAYQQLEDYSQPRGIMFWTINLEEQYGVNMAEGLNQLLHIRKEAKKKSVIFS